jgi:hypothetical protein
MLSAMAGGAAVGQRIGALCPQKKLTAKKS